MNKLDKPFKYKILFIFLFPTILSLYFSYYFVASKYKSQEKNDLRLKASRDIKIISKLIHAIQLERGLQAGYIAIGNKKLEQQKLLQAYKNTNKIYQDFLTMENKNSTNNLYKMLLLDSKKYKTTIGIKFSQIRDVRDRVSKLDMDFDQEIDYYTSINFYLLNMIYIYMSSFDKKSEYSIYKLERLKEYAGLERAYIYNYTLSHNQNYFNIVRDIVYTQQQLKKEFLLNSSLDNIIAFNNDINFSIEKGVDKFRKLFFKKELKSDDASNWFKISTKRINEFDMLINKMLDTFEKKIKDEYDNGKSILYFVYICVVMAFVFVSFLLYYLIKLIDKQKNMLNDLKISSYTFDSQEAMVITTPDGIILKVNKSFSKITGYEASEAVGKNVNILKSGRHDDLFYKDMWHSIMVKNGKWRGEIYNKRKNGEIYPERLSITAIKDDNDKTIYYIAQFMDISELKKAEELAIYQANHDFLTDLPNRKDMIAKLSKEIKRAKKAKTLNVFLFLDLDNFKYINDTYGHSVGDKVLIESTKRLKASIRSEDYIARISGDEFCIILTTTEHSMDNVSHNTKNICKKIIKNIEQPIKINSHKLNIGISIGIMIFPHKDKTINDIINSADAAMYQAKANGKNQFMFF